MAAPAPPPPVPTVDWFTIARHALDHIGLQGPNGALLSDVILETSCAETLMPHIWRVLRSHAELRFFSGAEQAGWRDWQLVAHTPVNSEQLAAMELEEAGQLRVLPSRQLHAKALWAGEYYESFFKDGRASDQWRALHEIGRRGAAGVLQNELCKLLEVASKHLFYSLAVLQRLGLIVEDWVGRVTTVHGRHNPQPTRRPPRAASAARLPCGSPSAQACLAPRGSAPLMLARHVTPPARATLPAPPPATPSAQVKEERKLNNRMTRGSGVTITSLVRLSRFKPAAPALAYDAAAVAATDAQAARLREMCLATVERTVRLAPLHNSSPRAAYHPIPRRGTHGACATPGDPVTRWTVGGPTVGTQAGPSGWHRMHAPQVSAVCICMRMHHRSRTRSYAAGWACSVTTSGSSGSASRGASPNSPTSRW